MNFWQYLASAIEKGDAAAIEAVAKDDHLSKAAVTAAGIGIGGALTPAAATKYFTTVTDQSGFLGRVTTAQVSAIEQDVDLFDVQSRQLQRVAEGSEPTEITGASNLGKRWHLKDVQMFPTVNFSTIVDRNRRGPDIEQYLAGKFATVFRNDLLELGLVGTLDDNSAGFATLNKGWPQLAKEALVGDLADQMLTTIPADTGIDHLATFDAMLQAMPDKYLTEGGTAFIMSKKDALAWGTQMALKDGLNPYLITGKVPSYNGYEVIGVPNWPSDTFMLTDPKNLAFGMGTQIQRYRFVNGRKRCVEYTWQLYADYLILNDAAVACSE